MPELGRLLIAVGLLLALIGVVVLLAGRLNLPLGRLPGDMMYRGERTTFYFPLVTSILLSIVLTVVFYLVSRWR